jgi:hypothetical protein
MTVAERGAHFVGTMPDDNDGRARTEVRSGPECVGNERATAEFVQRFGERGSHPGARARREDDDGKRRIVRFG